MSSPDPIAARLQALVETAVDGIITIDDRGRIESFNPAAERLFGFSAAEVIGHNVSRLMPSPYREEHDGYLAAYLTTGVRKIIGIGREVVGQRRDGSVFPLRLSVSEINLPGQRLFLGVVHDVSEIHRHREALQRQVKKLSFVSHVSALITSSQSLPDMLQRCAQSIVEDLDAAFARIWILNATGDVLELHASAGMYTHLDGPHGRVPVGQFKIGLIASERFPHLTNDVVGDPRVSNPEWARREGIVSFAGYPLLVDDRLIGVVAMFARRPLSDGVYTTLQAVAGNIALGIERKRAEELLHAKNAELKAFAYTVSHDLKAPLRGISGYAQELDRRHRAGLSERAQFCIQQVITATKNLDRLIEDLLHFSRLDAEAPSVNDVDLRALVQSLVKDREPVLAEGHVQLVVDLPPIQLRCWERGLTQSLANLLDNALKYSRKSQPPTIRIAAEELPSAWRITVTDNGIGFDMKYHERIFGLFNRLVRAEEFEGTGAGLAIVKKLVEKQRGRIWAESSPGNGATFFVEIPK